MKLISWNVNGLRACLGKGFTDAFEALDANFFCLQETKLQAGQVTLDLPGYHQFWNYAEKKGYSGTAIFAKKEPLSVRLGLGVPELDTEGRLITLEYENFFLVTCYTPNAQPELARIDHRLRWEDAFRDYLMGLDDLIRHAKRRDTYELGGVDYAIKEIVRRILRPGAWGLRSAACCRLYGFLPAFVPGRDRGVQLVELPVSCQGKECRLAYRLFPGVQPGEGPDPGGLHPPGDFRLRPLPRRTGY